jgi:hypothetical protein
MSVAHRLIIMIFERPFFLKIKRFLRIVFNAFGFEIKKINSSDIRIQICDQVKHGVSRDLVGVPPAGDIKIYVFFHKVSPSIESNLYHNVGLGSFRSKNMLSTDSDSADNISSKNMFYCELTGIYHIWRKEDKPAIVGTAHYRRYLNFLPLQGTNASGLLNLNWETASSILKHPSQEEQISLLLKTYDIIVPKSYFLSQGIAAHYQNAHESIGWTNFMSELDFLYGPNNHGLRSDRRAFWGNILIARKDLFDVYCYEMFKLIDRVFESVELPEQVVGARYQPFRFPGYLAERFLTAFINNHRLRYYEADLIQINDV